MDITQLVKRGFKLYSLDNSCSDAGLDYYKRPVLLNNNALAAWNKMVQAALQDGIGLFICSAFRDYNYQAKLIKNKLVKGQNITDILTLLAAPGFSEHYTGCAIDIISEEIPEISENFDKTLAFAWLKNKAHDFNFTMSFPKNNPYGIIYEPWHWCYKI